MNTYYVCNKNVLMHLPKSSHFMFVFWMHNYRDFGNPYGGKSKLGHSTHSVEIAEMSESTLILLENLSEEELLYLTLKTTDKIIKVDYNTFTKSLQMSIKNLTWLIA